MANKKIKIAIATHKMITGGIEKSLIDLCYKLIEQGIEVTLYLDALGGELYDKIPTCVKIIGIFEEYMTLTAIARKCIRRRDIKALFCTIQALCENQFHGDPVSAWEHTAGYLEKTSEEYDYAFAYGSPVSFSTVFVKSRIRAKEKYVWIHNDVRYDSLNIKQYSTVFAKYDKIVCVSKMGKKTFLEYFPEYTNKTIVFYNYINKQKIIEDSKEFSYDDGYKGVKLLTVGRLCSPKGQDIIPSIVEKLKKNGYEIRWYCVGEGEMRKELEELIHVSKTESNIVLLGNQVNPYPYFRMADIYVQPSRNEGFGITLSEAKIFSLPIVTTDFDGATEQITDKETGIIVHFDKDEIYSALVMLLDNTDMMLKFKQNLQEDSKYCMSDLHKLLYGEVL